MLPVANRSRRRFLALSAATAASAKLSPLAAAARAQQDAQTIPPPTVITGGIKPLFRGATARPLRYKPVANEFVIQNGGELFNRPLYGPISDFRVDAGDRPEFSLYLPGHGGNLKLGFITSAGGKWAADAEQVLARYRPGRMIYEIRDRKLGSGVLLLELLTAPTGSGILLRIEPRNLPSGTTIAWAFGGVSGRKGRRNGDIGCEPEPVSRFFQLRPEECTGNQFTLDPSTPGTTVHSEFCNLALTFPPGAFQRVEDFSAWTSPPTLADRPHVASPEYPILTGRMPAPTQPVFITVQRTEAAGTAPAPSLVAAAAFDARSKQLDAIANSLQFDTPDPYLNAAAPALAIVADALWDPNLDCVMHGCVAWRVALAGWRGPYVLDATGAHDRAQLHFRHWLKRQNTSAITTGDPATGPADPKTRLSRKEGLLHSNGDLSGNHYDMNMVFFDVLLRHLRWTGDVAFAKEIWPAFKRHLAWEHRLFRREFTAPDGTKLPLYEAYAAIWASDNLQYSGGGAAHSSAYNIFSFRFAATLAKLAGEDPMPYETEADLIHKAMQQLLWLPPQGAFAEAKDLMGPQTVYTNPALWTVYHTIDSEVPMPVQAWQMAADRLHTLPHVPIEGPNVPADAGYMLSCSDWLPYMWSLNLLLLAENSHFALALWQAGMADEAYKILRASLFDSMYMGLCPGDFHMTSALDPHRQEAQRDFGDPTGITARALVEGLFGVQPDLIHDSITLRPGFPSDWTRASIRHKDFELAWNRTGQTETYTFTSRFPKRAAITLLIPARTTSLPEVTNNNHKVKAAFDPEAIGRPMLKLTLPAAATYRITLNWKGEAPAQMPAHAIYALGASVRLPPGITPGQIEDPQQTLTNGAATALGVHTLFATIHHADATWSMPISFTVRAATPAFAPIPHLPPKATADPLDLTPILAHNLPDIFQRSYANPRSQLCTLSVPDTLLGGWANIGEPLKIDDAGLRKSNGTLKTPLGIAFRTPTGTAPNCLFLSYFDPDQPTASIQLTGKAQGLYLLLTGTTLPQCSHIQHALVTVAYADGTSATLPLRNPETWWPIEQDYLLDDFLFVDAAPLPPRVDLRTGETRLLTYDTFKGKGRMTPGGQATILHLPLDPTKTLSSLTLRVDLYNIVVALLAATLVRA